jgi:hypothetical protein
VRGARKWTTERDRLHDSLVPSGAVLSAGERLSIDGCGHNGLIYHHAVAREIVRRVRTIQAAAELCAGF